jgi:hypothetical protein
MGEVLSIAYLREMESNGCTKERKDADEDLLKKIHLGAKDSPFLKVKAEKLLKRQGFI